MFVLKANGKPIEIYTTKTEALKAIRNRIADAVDTIGYNPTYYTIEKIK